MNIKTMDLNLLRLFSTLYETKNASVAATRLGLSQPAVSHALQRLRDSFQDPLFVRSARGLTPTERAHELGPYIQKIFRELEEKFERKIFHPETDVGTFRIKGTDYFEQTVLPKFVSELQLSAPLSELISRSNQGVLPKEELERGAIDLAVAGYFGELPNGFYQQMLFQDELVGVAREKHPYFKNPGMKEYLKWPHMVISGEGKLEGPADRVLKKEHKKRKVVLSVAGFMPAGWIIQDSDIMIALPGRLARQLSAVLPVKTFSLPFKLEPIRVVQVWHEVVHQDERHKWFRKKLFDVCQKRLR
ncbi:MAG: LysR family transcriptional regulator [Bdellovibrionota bacterium]